MIYRGPGFLWSYDSAPPGFKCRRCFVAGCAAGAHGDGAHGDLQPRLCGGCGHQRPLLKMVSNVVVAFQQDAQLVHTGTALMVASSLVCEAAAVTNDR
jgi:hypothetical protein